MAYFNIKFFSNSLNRPVSFEMIIPNDGRDGGACRMQKMKTLFLLHGYTDGAHNWISEELMRRYNFAVVMPDGENSFYLDGLSTGHRYCTYIGEELTAYIQKTFNLALDADDTYIMGYSMGGFGAIHTALMYPHTFGKIGAMSSALIIHDIAHIKEDNDSLPANYHYYCECFGDLENVENSDSNPETLIMRIKADEGVCPSMYLCCGTEDFLLRNNRRFVEFLRDNDVSHIYHESMGGHDMVFWNEYTLKIIQWMFGQE